MNFELCVAVTVKIVAQGCVSMSSQDENRKAQVEVGKILDQDIIRLCLPCLALVFGYDLAFCLSFFSKRSSIK